MRAARGLSAVAVAIALVACVAERPDDDGASPDETFAEAMAAEVVSLASPDGALRIEIGLDEGAPNYRVVRVEDQTVEVVLGVSPLGLETSLGSFGSGLVVADTGTAAPWSDSFDLPTGKRRAASIVGVTRTVRFDAPAVRADVDLEVEVVATDHGAALRSRLVAGAGAAPPDVRLDWERTGFSVPPDSRVWLQSHDRGALDRPAYEQRRSAGREVTDPIRSAEGWTLPMLAETGAMWTLITEAGLTAGGAGSHLNGASDDGRFTLALPSAFDGNGVGVVEPVGALPFETPWRVIVNSPDLGDVVETDLVRHLSPPGPDLPWVEPGIASWSWWSDQDSPRDASSLRDFVDLAAEFGWRYSLVDANWTDLEEAALLDLVDHAASNDVGLLLWYNSGGPHNAVPEAPRGRMTDRSIRRAEMERIAELGISGIKVDFFHSDKPQGIQLYLDILADAADFELLVVFHGSTVPRGWSRAWPNLMTMEAVAGGAQYLFNEAFPVIAPLQNTVLPFTRNVVGSMDFTPMSLGDRTLRRTSNAHELALSIVFESGIQHFVDRPKTYAAQPDAVRAVLRDVPVAWDETRFVAGRPDEFVVMARRRGDAWWIGAINGVDDERVVAFDPSVIGVEGREAQVICDGDDKRSYAIADVVLDRPIDLEMVDEGGCLVRID